MNEVDYKLLVEQVQAFADTENDFVPLFSNVSALLYEALEDLNWVGFYLMDKGSLLLGPFQGKTACIRIQPGRGVCGTALVKDEVLRVANVHEFPGHIACDCASESDIAMARWSAYWTSTARGKTASVRRTRRDCAPSRGGWRR